MHKDIPERFVGLIKECDVIICDNELWADDSMVKLSDALSKLSALRAVKLVWKPKSEKKFIGRELCDLELVDGK